MHVLKIASLFFVSLHIASCGGGGGSNSGSGEDTPGTDQTVLTGQFIDSAVSGVRYETATHSGVTDSRGEFEYLAGEEVRFFLVDLLLGDATGAPVVSLFDLVDDVNPLVGTALSNAIAGDTTIRRGKRGHSFSTVINLAIFLQTLDSDNNPDNGIEISADVAALFASGSIDFNQDWNGFLRDYAFRHALVEARSRALLDEKRIARKPWQAMAHLYNSIGINESPKALHKEERFGDTFTGGEVVVHMFRYEFDIKGRLILLEEFEQISKEKITTTAYAYDDFDNLIRKEYDFDSRFSGRIETYAYDDYGRVIREEVDEDADGTIEFTDEHTYDAEGYLIHTTARSVFDDVETLLESFYYYSQGNLIREEHRDGDGITYSGDIYTYDDKGLFTLHEADNNGDGIPEPYPGLWGMLMPSYVRYSYNNNGQLIRESRPGDAISYSYNEYGDVLRVEITGYDLTLMDSTFVTTYTYNAKRMLTSRTDVHNDIVVAKYRYNYTAEGNLDFTEHDDNDDGVAEGVSRYHYDDEGNLIRSEPRRSSSKRNTNFTYHDDVDGWRWLFGAHVPRI